MGNPKKVWFIRVILGLPVSQPCSLAALSFMPRRQTSCSLGKVHPCEFIQRRWGFIALLTLLYIFEQSRSFSAMSLDAFWAAPPVSRYYGVILHPLSVHFPNTYGKELLQQLYLSFRSLCIVGCLVVTEYCSHGPSLPNFRLRYGVSSPHSCYLALS